MPEPLNVNELPVPIVIVAVVFVAVVMPLNAMEVVDGKHDDASGFVHVRRFEDEIANRPNDVAGFPGLVIFAMSKNPLISALRAH
jgi:hypothetical protein